MTFVHNNHKVEIVKRGDWYIPVIRGKEYLICQSANLHKAERLAMQYIDIALIWEY